MTEAAPLDGIYGISDSVPEGDVLSFGEEGSELRVAAEEFFAKLDEQLSNDIGYPMRKESMVLISRCFREDRTMWMRMSKLFKRHGILREVTNAASSAARAERVVGSERSLVSYASVIPSAPVPPEVVIPPQWVVAKAGDNPGAYVLLREVQREDRTVRVPVAQGYVVISSVIRDGDEPFWSISWSSPDLSRWHTQTVLRGSVASVTNALAQFGPWPGFPAQPENCKDILTYLRSFEIANLGKIPTREIRQQTGWTNTEGV